MAMCQHPPVTALEPGLWWRWFLHEMSPESARHVRFCWEVIRQLMVNYVNWWFGARWFGIRI